MHRHCRVVEPPAMPQRRTDKDERQQRSRARDDRPDCRLDVVEQRALLQQVADRVAGNTKLRKDRHPDRLAMGVLGHGEHRLGIGTRVGEMRLHRRGRDPHEPMPIERAERTFHAGTLSPGTLPRQRPGLRVP